MKRPHLVHFVAVKTEHHIAIRASITMKAIQHKKTTLTELEKVAPSFPIQAFRLLNAYRFEIKIVGQDKDQNQLYKKNFESDGLGNFYFKIPLTQSNKDISNLHIFEVKKSPGLEIHLGSYIPMNIAQEQKLIICDFDKTLVDTRYSSTKEVYHSLTKPLECFPTVNQSVDILKEKIEQGHHPFILSASPHFYEDAMRDWLYQNQIFTAGIFLKDYREVFSIFEGELTPKDLKVQGVYKLNHLLDILLMTEIPEKLVLMGDNFEADPIIYLSLAQLLQGVIGPRELWKNLKKIDAFEMSRKQNSQLLNKFYQLHTLITRHLAQGLRTDIKIYIRKKVNETQIDVPKGYEDQIGLIELYKGRDISLPIESEKDLSTTLEASEQ